jgi:arylsulfatase A-like enzyme
MMRASLLSKSTLVTGCLAFGLCLHVDFDREARAAEQNRPNIVVIVGDDMGYADVGVQGCKDIPTPNIDTLANAGVRCTSGYVSGPYCSPTRAGLLTGRYQTRFGHEFNPGSGRNRRQGRQGRQRAQQQGQTQRPARRRGQPGLPVSETTFANRMQAAGYKTGIVGKWHLGNAPKFRPLRRGFDEFFGFLGGAHSYFPVENPPILRDDEKVVEQHYLTDAFGREAVAFIDRHKDEPFFLYLAFNAVHTPMHANDERLQKFASIADKKRRTYAAMMSAMDDAVGQVLEKLHELNLDDNTLVFMISDNGGPTMIGTTTNASDNSPLRGSKRTTLEGGIRVPFFVKWPGHFPAGKVYEQPVIQLDILPTALAAAGNDLSGDATVEGVDLTPYLTGKNTDKPHDKLYWRFGQQMAIRDGDWKLVRYDPVVDGEQGRATAAKLYNLADDVGESNDLIDQHPEKAEALQAAWDEWNQSNVAPLWGPGSRQRRNAGNRAAASVATVEESPVGQ